MLFAASLPNSFWIFAVLRKIQKVLCKLQSKGRIISPDGEGLMCTLNVIFTELFGD